ncbi:hypothetical protein [Cohnella sp. AR92]|uniref:hypothetical protein n=1 Tax=Cohnella sp. AR92 TaxID=648716 RepID=UPI000F8CC836|nr:hypothetical protein [Cohnella sp. AR92]RUS46331.1 hypothetical protein ELR57_14745 [Cohnella sp. AR92]
MELNKLVETIVREIVGKLGQSPVRPFKLLFVCADSAAYEAYSDQYILLQKHGIAFDLLFLDGAASAWLGSRRIESSGCGRAIAADEFAPSPLELPLEYDGLLLPEVDLDSLGRATLAIRGTVLSDLLFGALVLGKPAWIGEDSPGLTRADRRTLKTLKLPKPYQNLFDYYKQELTMYGASFGPMHQLAELAADFFDRTEAERTKSAALTIEETYSPPATGEQAIPAASNEGAATIRFEGRLVSAEWVERQAEKGSFSRLSLGKRTLVSPLARDLLRDRGVFVYVGEEG